MAEYIRPTGVRIPRNPRTEYLYELESSVIRMFNVAAAELGNILGHTDEEFWTHTLPEALLSFLESWDTRAATLAAEVYLEKRRGEGD